MNWYGLNWLDILINIAVLSLLPGLGAAYGGYLAAESIHDPNRQRNVKFCFWFLFVCSLAITSWQQYRVAVADQARDTKGTWADAIALRQLQPNTSPPLFAYSKVVFPVKPDLGIQVINPKTPAVVIVPLVRVLAHNAKAVPIAWDLDAPSGHSLFVNNIGYEWIRPDQTGGAVSLLHEYDANNVVKNGHRIFGYISVTCPDCKRVRGYWVYFVYGQGGWYAEIPKGSIPNNRKIADAFPRIRKSPERFLAGLPMIKKTPIIEGKD